MITLFVRQGNQPEVEVKVPGNIARIGRAPGSQVQLTQEYVSKRHLRILKGIVIVDLASSNGTFLDGRRLKDPVLYTGGELRVGDGDVYMSIRLTEPDDVIGAPAADLPPDSAVLRRDPDRNLEALRSENQRLALQLADSKQRLVELEQGGARAAAPAAPAAPAGPSAAEREAVEALRQARAEIAGLQSQLAAASEVKPAVPQSPVAELFVKLQSENSSLKRKLAELQSKPGAAAAAPAPAPLESSSTKLLAEIAELRAQNAALRAAAASPRPVPAASMGTVAHGSGVRALFMRLATDDVDRQAPLLSGSIEEFLVVEQFRLVRGVERIVTRLAGDFIELLDGKTMLPQIQSKQGMVNLRALISRMGEATEDPDARSELLQYSAQLSRWLVAALGAERKAATAFAHKLKADLSEEALTAHAAIPALKRFSGQAEAELWRRAGLYLRELTPDMIQDRLEKLARAAALELVGEGSARS